MSLLFNEIYREYLLSSQTYITFCPIRIMCAQMWGLTSRLAAHLVQTAAGAGAAGDDDGGKDGNASKTKNHGQLWI